MASTSADVDIKIEPDNQEDDSNFDRTAAEPAADTQETTQITSSQGGLAHDSNEVDEKALADYVVAQLLSGKSFNSSIPRTPPFLRSLVEQPYSHRMLLLMNAFVKDVEENCQELYNPSTWSGDEASNHGNVQYPTSLNELLVRPNDIFDAKFDTTV